MTTVDGIRVSKYSIKAIKIGKKVSAQTRAEFEKFNAEHVGEDSVFPTKNGAPKMLEQFKDKPYTLELRDEFTMGIKPKSLPTIKAMHYHGKPATCKVLEHFVRTTYGTKHLQQVVTFLIGRRFLAFHDMTIENGPKA